MIVHKVPGVWRDSSVVENRIRASGGTLTLDKMVKMRNMPQLYKRWYEKSNTIRKMRIKKSNLT